MKMQFVDLEDKLLQLTHAVVNAYKLDKKLSNSFFENHYDFLNDMFDGSIPKFNYIFNRFKENNHEKYSWMNLSEKDSFFELLYLIHVYHNLFSNINLLNLDSTKEFSACCTDKAIFNVMESYMVTNKDSASYLIADYIDSTSSPLPYVMDTLIVLNNLNDYAILSIVSKIKGVQLSNKLSSNLSNINTTLLKLFS